MLRRRLLVFYYSDPSLNLFDSILARFNIDAIKVMHKLKINDSKIIK